MGEPAGLVEMLVGCGRAVEAAVTEARRSATAGELAAELGLGADGAPTSQIDAVAEAAALAYLDRLPPQWRHNVLSEEIGLLDRGASLTLVIDPIDSTNNAITDFPYYAFSIAACDPRPLAGCVINLPTGDCWTAARGHGATINGRPLVGSGVTTLAQAILATVRPKTPADLERLRPALFGARRLRITGCTALDVCLIASGTLHGFLNPCRYTDAIWGEKVVDYAAAALILEETGGAVCDEAGRPLTYPLDVRHRLCLQAAATPALLDELVDCLGRVEATSP